MLEQRRLFASFCPAHFRERQVQVSDCDNRSIATIGGDRVRLDIGCTLMNLAFFEDTLDHWKALETGRSIWHGVKEEARRVPRNRLNSRMKSWASRRSISGHSTTKGPFNPSHKCLESPKPNSTVSLLWFNFWIARNSGIELFEALFVIRAYFC